MGSRVRDGVARLLAAAEDGSLAALCTEHRVELMVLFGSTADPEADAEPGDIDVAVRFVHAQPHDVVAVTNALIGLTRCNDVDLMDLGRAGAVARYEALGRGTLLYEADPRTFAEAQMFAVRDYLDTRWLRRLRLEVMGA